MGRRELHASTQIQQLEPIGLVQIVDGMDVVDGVDITFQVNLFGVHVVHKVHAVRHIEKRLQF
jgi:hypothetical protein